MTGLAVSEKAWTQTHTGALLAIDPGYTQSAWMEFAEGKPLAFGIEPNAVVLDRIARRWGDRLAIECVAGYGMVVGAEVFETCVWAGRFIQRWIDCHYPLEDPGDMSSVHRVYRKDVKLHLCGATTAKDPNVRQALIDRYGPGKAAAVGVKKAPGPLYGVSKDAWAALAVAVTVADGLASGALR